MMQTNNTAQRFVSEFMEMVIPPGGQKGVFDERMTFEEAVEFAQKTDGDYGEPLLEALRDMAREALFDERAAVKELTAV